jgi:amino acid permease
MSINGQKRSARAVSLFVFVFSVFVSGIVFFKNESLDVYDYLLMVLAPLVIALITYFTVLHNDPDAPD